MVSKCSIIFLKGVYNLIWLLRKQSIMVLQGTKEVLTCLYYNNNKPHRVFNYNLILQFFIFLLSFGGFFFLHCRETERC